MPTRRELLSAKAAKERAVCAIWLEKFVIDGQPKLYAKDELWLSAKKELGISRSSFDFAWIDIIERENRPDWYEPLRRGVRRRRPM